MSISIAITDSLWGDIGEFIRESIHHFRSEGYRRDEIVILFPAYIQDYLRFTIAAQVSNTYQGDPKKTIHDYFYGIRVLYNGYKNECVVYPLHWFNNSNIEPQILELKKQYITNPYRTP